MLAPTPATVQSEPRAGHDLFYDPDAAATDAEEFVSHRDLDAAPDRRIPTWRLVCWPNEPLPWEFDESDWRIAQDAPIVYGGPSILDVDHAAEAVRHVRLGSCRAKCRAPCEVRVTIRVGQDGRSARACAMVPPDFGADAECIARKLQGVRVAPRPRRPCGSG
jgi:hypothetical protein